MRRFSVSAICMKLRGGVENCSLAVSLVAATLLGTASAAAPLVIYETAVTGESGNIADTKMGLAVNVPNAKWAVFGGWRWSDATIDQAGVYRSNEEKCGLALPLDSAGAYVRPDSITITASIRDNLEKDDPKLGIGFWKEWMPESYDGEHEYNSGSGFYGIRYSPRRHVIRLVIDGAETGDEVSVLATDITVFHEFTFTIDTTNGSIRDVMCDGEYVLGLPETSEFTAEHTKYVGAASLWDGRLIMNRLTVTEGIERPEVPVFALTEDVEEVAYVGESTSLDVSAVGSSSGTLATVTAAPFGDSGAYAIDANGTFTWTPAAVGTYVLTFTAILGNQTARRRATYTVYGARPTSSAGTWEFSGDGAFASASANLLKGIVGTETSADGVEVHETQGPIASLTDGAVSAWNDTNGRYLVRNNSVIEWHFAAAAPISEIRIYSGWGDHYRNDIRVKSMEYLDADGNWALFPVDAFSYSVTESLNTIGSFDDTLLRRRVAIALADGGNLVESAAGLRIYFDTQDHNYAGYSEIEAIAPVAFASPWAVDYTSATATVQLSDAWQAAGATLAFAYAPQGEALPAPTALASVGGEAVVTLPALTSGRTYDYAFTASAPDLPDAVLSGSLTTKAKTGLAENGLMQTTLSGDNNLTDGADYEKAVLTAGPVMAFTTQNWGSQTTYLYTGFLYLKAGVTYGFGAKIDDRANITIDGTAVIRSGNYAYASGTYTPSYTGWHPVDIRVGNGTGGAGPFGGFVGLAYNEEGATAENYGAWIPLTDNGDGTLFVTTRDGSALGEINILSLLSRPGTATLSVETRLDQTADLYVWTGATYGGTDRAAWDSEAHLGSVGTGSDTLMDSVSAASGATLVRVVAYPKDADPATDAPIAVSKTWALAEFPSTTGEPVIVNPQALSAAAASADIGATILYAGSGSTATVTIDYGPAADNLLYSATLSTAATVGAFEATLQGLLPSRTYYARLTVTGGDSATAQTAVFTFATTAMDESVAPTAAEATMPLPGLMQGRYVCVKSSPADTSVRIADLPAADTDRTLGFLMAQAAADSDNGSPSMSDSVSTGTWKWADATTYYYEGAVYLEGGTTLYVASKFDDGAAVYIDDVEVFHEVTMAGNGSGYNHKDNYNIGAFTPEKTGWHPIRGYIWDWEGGKNHMYGLAAIQWTTDATAIDLTGTRPVAKSDLISDATYWHEFYDNGTGSFLRTAVPERALEVASYDTPDNALVAVLAYGAFTDITPLYVAYGPEYGGDDTNAWAHVEKVGDIGTDAGTVTPAQLTGLGETVRYVRFFFDLSSVNGALCFTPTLTFVDMNAPSLSPTTVVTGVEQGDGAVVNGELLSPGASGTCTVTLETSRTGDFSDAFVHTLGDYSAAATLLCDLTTADTTSPGYIVPGTTTWYRFKAIDANNLADYTPIASFTTPAGAMLANPSASASAWNATYSVDVTDVGAGSSATVELWTGLSYSTLALSGSATVTEAGTVTIPVEHDKFMRYAYRFRVTNACATESWESWTDIAYLDVNDNASYVWKAGVYEGDWEDAANWVSSVDDPRCAYPNSTLCAVSFANCEEGKPVVVSLNSAVSVNTLALGTAGIDLTIAGVDTETSRLMVGAGDGTQLKLPANASLTLSGLYARFHDYTNQSGSKLRLENGAEVLSHTECVLGAGNNALEVVDGSSFQINNFLLRLSGQSPRLLVDDSTVYLRGNFAPSNNRNTRDPVITFAGHHPYLWANGGISPSEADGTPGDAPVFRFNVPEEGYAEGPVVDLTADSTFPNGGRLAIRIEIDRASAWYKGSKTASFKLVSATKRGIATDWVDLSNQPKASRTTFYYTYGANDSTEPDGKNPTGLWAKLDGRRATTVIIR